MSNIRVSVSFGRITFPHERKFEPPTLEELVAAAISSEVAETRGDWDDIERAACAAIEVVRNWDKTS